MICREVCDCLCFYLDGELDLEKADEVEMHLRFCSACKRELELQRTLKRLLQRRLGSIAAPDSLWRSVRFELARAEEYRESGIQVLDLVLWGAHIAQFYNTKDDVPEILVPYVEKGLEDNELCLWITSEMSEGDARDALSARVPKLQRYIDRRQLQFFSCKDWYLSKGRFDLQKTLDSASRKYQEALSNGYAGFRVTGEASWLELPDWDSFMEYESLLNSAISSYKALAVCVYKEGKCTTDNVVDVMDRHKYVISKMDDSWQLRRLAEIG
jgi:hypothetical protein